MADQSEVDALETLWDRSHEWMADVLHEEPDSLWNRASHLFDEVAPEHATAIYVLGKDEPDEDTAWHQPAALLATHVPPSPPPAVATALPEADDDGDHEGVFEFICAAVTTGFSPPPAAGEVCAGLTAAEKKVRLRDLTPAERELVRKAEAKEFASMRTFEVFEPVTHAQKAAEQTQPCNILRLKFIYEWRVIDGVKGIKARP